MSDLIKNFVDDGDEAEEQEVPELEEDSTNEIEDQEVETDETDDEQAEEVTESTTEEKTPVTPKEPTHVPLSALQEERKKKQAYRDELLELLEEKIAAQKAAEPEKPRILDPNDPDPMAGITDDDYDMMLPSEQRKLAEARLDWKQRENDRLTQYNQRQYAIEMEKAARQKLSADAMGEGWDFDSIVKTGNQWLTDDDKNAIRNDIDPAKKLYDLCIERCPYLSKAKAAPSTSNTDEEPEKKVVNKVNTKKQTAPTMDEAFSDSSIGNLVNSFLDG